MARKENVAVAATIGLDTPREYRMIKGISLESPGAPQPAMHSSHAQDVGRSPFTAEYIKLVKSHDPRTEMHFVAYFSARLRVQLGFRGLRKMDECAVIQETLARVLEAVQNGGITAPGALAAYVCQVSRNVLAERPALEVDADGTPKVAESLDDFDSDRRRRQHTRKVLDDLLPEDRQLLHAKIVAGLNSEQLVAKFGAFAPDRLRVLFHHACKRFARFLQLDTDGERMRA